MRKPSLSSIRVGNMGCLDVSIPVLTFGSGRPILTLVTGVHGDETAGLFVVEQLIRTLGEFDGQLRVIPSANPVAQAMMLRASPRDDLDLNRIFPGSPNGQLPEIMAYQLVKTLADSDLVIDFHSFALRNPVMAILANTGDAAMTERSLALIRAFQPVVIWQLDIEVGADGSYRGALAPTLHAKGVPNFAVEMPINHRLTMEETTRTVSGIRAVMARLGMLAGGDGELPDVPVFRREEHYAPTSGLFFPLVEMMTSVRQGQAVARISGLTDFQNTEVCAPFDGMLLQIHDRDLVTTGTAVLAMGIPG